MGDVLASPTMTRNTAALREVLPLPDSLRGRRIVLVGLMGAGKTSIGRRLAARLGLPFLDADAEIELAAGCSIPELFARYGEAYFREGEKKVIRRLLAGGPAVVAYRRRRLHGPRHAARSRGSERFRSGCVATCPPWCAGSRAGKTGRCSPTRTMQATMARLMAQRYPIYAEADVIVDCGDEMPEITTSQVVDALIAYAPPRRLPVVLSSTRYDVVIGDGLLARAGALLAPVLPQKRAVVVSDANVAASAHADRARRAWPRTGSRPAR